MKMPACASFCTTRRGSAHAAAPLLFHLQIALNIPCLLVYGDKDPAVVIPDGEYSLSTMTHQVELESSGHFPMIDETTRFNRLLTDFLALDSGSSPRDLQMKEEWRRRVR